MANRLTIYIFPSLPVASRLTIYFFLHCPWQVDWSFFFPSLPVENRLPKTHVRVIRGLSARQRITVTNRTSSSPIGARVCVSRKRRGSVDRSFTPIAFRRRRLFLLSPKIVQERSVFFVSSPVSKVVCLSAGFCVYWWSFDFCCGGRRARVFILGFELSGMSIPPCPVDARL